MPIRRLLPVLLVLLQPGLAAGHAHAHPGFAAHTEAPHLHAHGLLDLFTPDHDEHDGDDHDADAVDLSNLTASAAPPAPDTFAIDLAHVDMGPASAADSGPPRAPLGLPPSTAGPSAPRYITFCCLTI